MSHMAKNQKSVKLKNTYSAILNNTQGERGMSKHIKITTNVQNILDTWGQSSADPGP